MSTQHFSGHMSSQSHQLNGVTINGNAIFPVARATRDRLRSRASPRGQQGDGAGPNYAAEHLDLQKCHASLEFEGFGYKESTLDKPTKGTCEWLYQTAEYLHWVDERGLLLVRGNPGSGKSTLLKFVVENELRAPATPKHLVLRFLFHSSGTELQKSMEGFLRSIILQLVDQNTGCKESFHDMCRRRMVGETAEQRTSGTIRWHHAELKSMVETLILDENIGSGISMFVDAIDECWDQDRSELLGFLHRLKGSDEGRLNHPKIFLTCRVYPDENFMGDFNIRLEKNNQDDIRKYVGAELRITGEQDSDIIDFQNSLASQTGGLFLWLRLAVNRVHLMSSHGFPLSYIGSQIFECPRELDSLYIALLESIKDEEISEAGRLFQWVRFSRRPLYLEEIKIAMKFHDDGISESTCKPENVRRTEHGISDLQMKKRILHLGKGLIGIADTALPQGRAVVGFHHETVKDFIDTVGLQYLDSRSSEDRGLAKTADLHLANKCISYLSSQEIHEVIPVGSRVEPWQFLFLNYAGDHWLDHAVQAELKELETLVKWPTSKMFASWPKFRKDGDNRIRGLQEQEGTTLLHLAADRGLVSLAKKIMASPSKVSILDKMLGTPVAEAMALGIEYLWSLVLFAITSVSYNPCSPTVEMSENEIEKTKLNGTVLRHSRLWAILCWGWKERKARQEIVRACDARGRSAIHRAAAKGRFEMVRFLHSLGAALNVADREGETPMFLASKRGQLELVEFLYTHGASADIHKPNNAHWTPVHVAAQNGHLDVIKFLCAHGVDIYTPEYNRPTPMAAASWKGHFEIVKFLFGHETDADVYTVEASRWMSATAGSRAGHPEIVKFLHDHGGYIDIHAFDEDDRTPLYNASSSGDLEAVKFLFSRGAIFDLHDDFDPFSDDHDHGWTPLIAACYHGNLEIVEFLCAHGAEDYIDTPNYGPLTAMTAASIGGHLEIVEFLHAQGASIDTPNREHWTPIFAASRKGHLDIVKFLYSHGANVHTPNNRMWTPIFAASNRGHLAVVEFLFAHGADVDIHTLDNEEWTPLYAASGKGYLEIVKFLLSHGAYTDIEIPDDIGRTPLYTAADTGRLGVVKYLCENGANIHAVNDYNETPIHGAAGRGHLEVVKYLYEHGADIDVHIRSNTDGTTPLTIAARGRHVKVVEFLRSRIGLLNRDLLCGVAHPKPRCVDSSILPSGFFLYLLY
ncbi:unnamed protein product [Penicillium salamii]|nr:unnamed protein product [Penicillium salamii]